jgi:hypothetical protein
METEVARRTAADGLTERTFSRIVAVTTVVTVVLAVVLTVRSTHASGAAKNLGMTVAVGSGAALLAIGLLGRGAMFAPIWLLTAVSALCTLTLDYPISDSHDVARRVVRAGLLGLAIVAAGVATQFASDRRFATPVAHGQVRVSAFTLVVQLASATLGLAALVVTIPASSTVSYGWFVGGAVGLFSLVAAAAAGLRRR